MVSVASPAGPEEALELAHRRWEERRSPDSDVELEIVAIFHGRPPLVDFDDATLYPSADGSDDGGDPPGPEEEG